MGLAIPLDRRRRAIGQWVPLQSAKPCLERTVPAAGDSVPGTNRTWTRFARCNQQHIDHPLCMTLGERQAAG